MRSETVELDDRFGEEYAGEYVFKEITWAKRSRILQKHTRYHPTTGRVLNSDYVAIQAETVMASLKKQPKTKPLTLEKLLSEDEDGVPIELGELVSKVVNKLNGVTHEDLHFLLEQLDEESRIQLFQSFGFVESSSVSRPSSESSRPEKSKSLS